jgi:superoxide reductase
MALEQGEIYKGSSECEGVALVEVVQANENACDLACCGKPMEKLEAKTADAATEKHVPVIEAVDGGYKVTVGSVPHPMEEAHYIEWIELSGPSFIYRHYLKPGDAPEAIFKVDAQDVSAREHCNKHGLWKG